MTGTHSWQCHKVAHFQNTHCYVLCAYNENTQLSYISANQLFFSPHNTCIVLHCSLLIRKSLVLHVLLTTAFSVGCNFLMSASVIFSCAKNLMTCPFKCCFYIWSDGAVLFSKQILAKQILHTDIKHNNFIICLTLVQY